MSLNWKNFTTDQIERHFNPRIAVPNFEKYIVEAQQKAKSTRVKYSNYIDIPYGEHELQKLDIFCKSKLKNAPVHIFIHGGYWRALDKSDHSHLAEPFINNNCLYISINYGLCPYVRLTEITKQIKELLIWVYKNCHIYGGNPNNINISGHSAGAHLAAMILNSNWEKLNLPANIIKSAFLVSGIYEPEVVLKLSLNKDIGLTKEEANNNTPVPCSYSTKLFLSVGDKEPNAWIEQTKRYSKLLIDHDNIVNFTLLKSQNHFSILNILSDSNSKYVNRMIEVTCNE